jgi:hypothetical protein
VQGLGRTAYSVAGREASLEVHVTIIDRAGVRRTSCSVPMIISESALRRWLTKALDLGDPAAWHVNIRRRSPSLGVLSVPLCDGDHLYLIRRP